MASHPTFRTEADNARSFPNRRYNRRERNILTAIDADEEGWTGDITVLDGVTAIGAGKVLNSMVGASAAIAFSKLAALSSGNILVGNGSNVATSVALSGDATLANTGALTIAAGAITGAKMAALPSTNILVGNGSNVATAVAMSGDATLANTGALTIAAGAIVDSKVGASAAIAFSKLAALNSAQILVGNGSNVATAVALSGDATISNAGALTIANNAVTSAKLANNAVDFAQLATDVLTQTAVVSLTQSQILNLSATPVQLIAQPGAGKAIYVEDVEFLHTFSTTVYANGGKLQVQYHGTTDILDIGAGVVTGGASANYFVFPSSGGVDNSTGSAPSALQTMSSFANLAVDLTNASAPFINGNAANILKVRITYKIVTLMT